MNTRDNNLDFFRGIASIWIILIHTCFWSGSMYLPDIIRSLALIIDVPIFMFIAGESFNHSNSIIKNIKGLVKLWIKYLVFLLLFFGIIAIIDRDYINISNIISAIFFKFSDNSLRVVDGSLWFIFMYFIVSLLGSTIICIYKRYNKDLDNFRYIIVFLLLIYGMSLFNPTFLFINTNNIMYLFIYCLGYYLYNIEFSNRQICGYLIVNSLLFILLLKICSFNFYLMQEAKSGNHLLYLVYSMFSVFLVCGLKDRLHISTKNFLQELAKIL